MNTRTLALLACAVALLGSTAADAQIGEWLNKVIAPMTRPATQDSLAAQEPPAADTPASSASAARTGTKTLQAIDSEMAPDVLCNRPRERFNIGEKLADFGGTAAALQLQRLVESDFKYTDLKPEDHRLLRYLAQTTVWLPAEAEARLGSIYDFTAGLFAPRTQLNELQRSALEQVAKQLDGMRQVVADYPADIQLKVDTKLDDGAFARFGGLILLSERFLNGLAEAGIGADYLLAHEVSHIYKRHAMKSLQFRLISSAEGWDIAKPLLRRAQRGMQTNLIGDGIFLATTMPRLIDFVRSVQIRFGKDQELEADACAVVWLTKMGVDANAAWDGYQAALGATSYGAEHPSNEEREARFKAKAAGEPQFVILPRVDKGSVKAEGRILFADPKQARPK